MKQPKLPRGLYEYEDNHGAAERRATHRHRSNPAATAWFLGTVNGTPASAYGASGVAYHGDCPVTGAHIITDVCACGARRYSSSANCPVRWLGGDEEVS